MRLTQIDNTSPIFHNKIKSILPLLLHEAGECVVRDGTLQSWVRKYNSNKIIALEETYMLGKRKENTGFRFESSKHKL